MLKATEHRPLNQLALSLADRRDLLDDCTVWARLLYSHDRAAFRNYVRMARQLAPDIAPTNPKYVSVVARYFGYEAAEAVAKLVRTPKNVVRKTLERLELRSQNSVFDLH
ncbi:MAG: hypothetical protein WDN69_09350 [Aliidongia sp.]